MPTSTSRLAYDDVFDLLERAMEGKGGARVRCQDEGEAKHLRTRIHTARKIDRADNHRDLEPGDPLYNASRYDVLCCMLSTPNELGEIYLYLCKRSVNTLEIEELEEDYGVYEGDRRDHEEANQ